MIHEHTRKMVSEADWLEHRGEYIGLCAQCGEERSCTEPDARGYQCESCGEDAVFGAESYAFEGCAWTDTLGDKHLTSWVGGFK